MGRVCYGPSLSWAKFVMGRDVPESQFTISLDKRKLFENSIEERDNNLPNI